MSDDSRAGTASPVQVEETDQNVADLDEVARMAAGDASALAALYDRHATAIYSLALRITRRPQDAEDVTQQVFTQAWQTAARHDSSRGVVAARLLITARSRALDYLRRRESAREATADDSKLAAIPDPEPGGEYVVATRLQVEQVSAAMAALPDEQRRALELAYYEGLTQREIAWRTSTPLGTVKTRVRTALMALRIAIMGQGRPAGDQS